MTEAEWNASADPAAMLRHLTHKRVHAVGQFGTEVVRETPLISDRKLRLLACACCRLTQSMHYPEAEAVVRAAEKYADDDFLSVATLLTARKSIEAIGGWFWCVTCPDIAVALRQTLHEETTERRGYGNVNGLYLKQMAEATCQIVGNPFSPVTLPAGEPQRCVCLTESRAGGFIPKYPNCFECHGTGTIDGPCPWLTPLVVSLAENAYEDHGGRKCGTCKGEGGEQTYTGYGNVESRECPDCHGSGRIGVGQLDQDRLAVLSDAAEEAGCDDERVLRHLRGWVPCWCVGKWKDSLPQWAECTICGGSRWCRRTIPFFRGDAILDLFLGRS